VSSLTTPCCVSSGVSATQTPPQHLVTNSTTALLPASSSDTLPITAATGVSIPSPAASSPRGMFASMRNGSPSHTRTCTAALHHHLLPRRRSKFTIFCQCCRLLRQLVCSRRARPAPVPMALPVPPRFLTVVAPPRPPHVRVLPRVPTLPCPRVQARPLILHRPAPRPARPRLQHRRAPRR
jgi:hypothetical protein